MAASAVKALPHQFTQGELALVPQSVGELSAMVEALGDGRESAQRHSALLLSIGKRLNLQVRSHFDARESGYTLSLSRWESSVDLEFEKAPAVGGTIVSAAFQGEEDVASSKILLDLVCVADEMVSNKFGYRLFAGDDRRPADDPIYRLRLASAEFQVEPHLRHLELVRSQAE